MKAMKTAAVTLLMVLAPSVWAQHENHAAQAGATDSGIVTRAPDSPMSQGAGAAQGGMMMGQGGVMMHGQGGGMMMGVTASMVVQQTDRGDAMFLTMAERSAHMVLDHREIALAF